MHTPLLNNQFIRWQQLASHNNWHIFRQLSWFIKKTTSCASPDSITVLPNNTRSVVVNWSAAEPKNHYENPVLMVRQIDRQHHEHELFMTKKKDHLGMVRINTIIYYVVLIYPHPKKPPKKGLIELAGTLISSSDIGGSMNVSKLSQCHQIQTSCLRCSGWRHVGARRCCLCPRRGPSFSCRVQWPSLHEQLEGWTWSGHMACSYHTSRLLQAWDRSSCRTSGNSRPWHFHPQ